MSDRGDLAIGLRHRPAGAAARGGNLRVGVRRRTIEWQYPACEVFAHQAVDRAASVSRRRPAGMIATP